jgi:hypothetical protein
MVLVSQQQDAGSPGLGRADGVLPAEGLQLVPLVGREMDLVLTVGNGHPRLLELDSKPIPTRDTIS